MELWIRIALLSWLLGNAHFTWSVSALQILDYGHTQTEVTLTIRTDEIAITNTAALHEALELQARASWNASDPWIPVTTPITVTEAEPDRVHVSFPMPTADRQYFRVVYRPGPPTTDPGLRINEVMADNDSVIADGDGDFSDWIELINPSDGTISLAGYHLSDDPRRPLRWPLPPRDLSAGETWMVFASGKDRVADGEWHTNFRLDADGESVLLSDRDGRLVDSLRFSWQRSDQSIGRPRGEDVTWVVFEGADVSPATANSGRGRLFIEPVELSIDPGLHANPFSLSFRLSPLATAAFYTLDGSEPTPTSLRYSSPFTIDRTTIVRAVAMDERGGLSAIETGTYLIGAQHSLPVVSIGADPDHFDIRDGFLYGFGGHMFTRDIVTATYPYSSSNAWRDREIEASFEFFEPDGDRAVNQALGVKIFGGWGSRGYPQKSLALFARSRYGPGKIRHRLFPDLPIEAFEAVVLRNSGNDNQSTHQIPPRPPIDEFSAPRTSGSYFVNGTYTLFRDAIMARLGGRLGLDVQAYRPTVVYLNGEYWGIYNLREKLNEHYVASHHDIDSEQVDLIEGYGSANAGSATTYNQMRGFVDRLETVDARNYRLIQERFLDIDNFIDYHLSVIYCQNFDIGNIKCWRPQNRGLFRWMLYDQDYGFHLWPEAIYVPAMARDYGDYDNMFRFYTNTSGNGTGWPNAAGRTLLLRRMLTNDEFQQRFITRCADLLNTQFSADSVSAVIDQMAAGIRDEIPRHLERWSWPALADRGFGSPFKPEDEPFSPEIWERHVDIARRFAMERPAKVRTDLMNHFGLQNGIGDVIVEITPPGSGAVQLNSLRIDRSGWQGLYFADIPNTVLAEPAPGFEFDGWDGDALPSAGAPLQARIQPVREGPSRAIAHFRRESETTPPR